MQIIDQVISGLRSNAEAWNYVNLALEYSDGVSNESAI